MAKYEDIAPRLGYLLNELNNTYATFYDYRSKLRHPISLRVEANLKDLVETMIFEIEREYPNFKVVGGLTGYNLIKSNKIKI